MTKREMFNAAIAIIEGREDEILENDIDVTEVTDGLRHELELLDKRNASKGGMTKTQKENVEIKDRIAEVMADLGEKVTVTELITDERLKGLTCQKVSALLRLMIKDGLVGKEKEGKKMLYFLA